MDQVCPGPRCYVLESACLADETVVEIVVVVVGIVIVVTPAEAVDVAVAAAVVTAAVVVVGRFVRWVPEGCT